MYSPQVLDHFEHPRNAGAVRAPSAAVRMENPACGDTLELSLGLDGGRIEEIGFLAKGCVASMACASALTELARGKSIAEARRISSDDLVHAVGGLPPASSHAAQLAIDALRATLDRLQKPDTL
jgi:NifU-like protein involved in Fe-S cluster formation